MIKVLEVLAVGGAGGSIGWFAGMILCPNPGDLGIGTIPWAIGGAIVGSAVGVGAAVAIFT